MPNNLTKGFCTNCTITSLIEGEPKLGVHLTRPGFQQVVTNAPVTEWKVTKVEGKEHQYLFGVGGYNFTESLDDRVFASIHPDQSREWYITYKENHDAYTIEIEGTGTGWTVSGLEGDGDNAMLPLVISPIIATASLPPQYLPKQLFRFSCID
ncbi:hypothetical protein BS17DRAFT_819709 [Gyrodon lividus]|nr:hypothetical protein BS17DRAFT_819709 [Gyrodon lividus]